MIIASDFYKWLKIFGVATGGGPPPVGALLAVNNLSDVLSSTSSVENIGLGRPGILVLTEADFAGAGGTYVLTNPPPIYVSMSATTPGRVLQLPPQNQATSLQASQNITLLMGSPSEAINVNNGAGTLLSQLPAASEWRAIPNDRTSIAGAWELLGNVQTINLGNGGGDLSGSLFFPGGKTVYVDINVGVDEPVGRGSVLVPYRTLAYALNNVTGTSLIPVQIIANTGGYSETNLTLKPWVYIYGNASSITVTNPVTLDPSWSAGGNGLLKGFYNADFQGGTNLDFDAIAQAGLAVFTFDDINGASNYTYTANGSTTGTTIVVFNQIVGYGSQQDVNVTNCYGGMSNSTPNNVTYTQSDAVNGHVWNMQSSQTIGNLSIESNAGNLTYFSNALNSYGAFTLYTTGTGTMTAYPLRSSALGGVKFDSVGSGLNVTVDSYFLANPIIVGTPVITYGTLAGGMSADFPGPVNYIPVTPEVKGHLQGIDAALGGATGVPPAYAEMFFQGNATVTTIAAANTPVKVNATYTSGILSNFSQGTGTITYTDVPSRTVNVSAKLTAYYNGTAQKTSFYIALNGVVVAKSKQQAFIGPATNEPISNPCQCLLSLITGDTLELWVENNDNTNDVIVNDLNFTVQSIAGFDSGSLFLAGENYLSLVGDTLTANPVNLSGTNVTGDLPFSKLQQVSTSRLVGRYTAGTGDIEEVKLGTNLSFTGDTLNAASGASVSLQIAYNNGPTIVQTAGGYNPVRLQKDVQEPITEEIFYNNLAPTVPIVTYQKNFLAYDASNLGIDFVTEKLVYWDSTGSNAKFSYSWEMYEGGLFNVQYEYMAVDSRYKQVEMFRPVRISDTEDLSTVVANSISCLIDTDSTTRGTRLWPRLTTAQKNLILSPVQGLTVYDTTQNKPNYYDGADWQSWSNVFTLATSQTPRSDYSASIGVFTSVVTTWSGSNVIAANSVTIGQTIELTLNGYTSAVTTGGSGILRVQIGATTADSQTFTSSLGGANSQRLWQMTFAVTRSSSTTASISVVGFVENDSRVMIPMQIYINPTAFTFDFTIANTMDVLYNMTIGVDAYNFVARNLKIVKY